MISQPLSLRNTHRYVGTFRHLDEWDEIGTIHETTRVQHPRTAVDLDDACDPRTYTITVAVELDAPRGRDDIIKAIRATYSSRGCAHEHDCCGCVSTSVSVIEHIGGDYFQFQLHSSRNY